MAEPYYQDDTVGGGRRSVLSERNAAKFRQPGSASGKQFSDFPFERALQEIGVAA